MSDHPPKFLLNTAAYLGKQTLTTEETMEQWKNKPDVFVEVILQFMKAAKFDPKLPFYYRVKDGEIILTQMQKEVNWSSVICVGQRGNGMSDMLENIQIPVWTFPWFKVNIILLDGQEHNLSELQARTGVKRTKIAHHLKTLENHNLVTRIIRKEQNRGIATHYFKSTSQLDKDTRNTLEVAEWEKLQTEEQK